MNDAGKLLVTLTEVYVSDSLYDMIERARMECRPFRWLIGFQLLIGVWRRRQKACKMVGHTLGSGLVGPLAGHSPIHAHVRTAVPGMDAGGGGVAVVGEVVDRG